MNNLNPSIMKVLAGVIYISALALLILGALSYYTSPLYEKGAWAAIEAFKDVLLVAVGVKGGAFMSTRSSSPSDGTEPHAPEEKN